MGRDEPNNSVTITSKPPRFPYSSDQGGECVEVAAAPCATVAVRDSKNPAGPHLSLGPAAFSGFVTWAAATAAG
ncbi:DUF397 domain-containing protein [Streptomyces sp. YIM S03343]